MQRAKAYYKLMKPGIVYGNALTVVAGFLLAAQGKGSLWLLFLTTVGVSFVMAGACVFNNYLDRGIDAKMKRTSRRALVTGEIATASALVFGVHLTGAGFVILAIFTNTLTVLLGVLAVTMYVVVYGIAKRASDYGTLVGSIPGALPLVAGYAAVTGSFDRGALLLFVILALWQLPHFYAIAMFRRDEYAAAGIPVLTVTRGMHAAKIRILLYIAAFTAAAALLALYGYTGYVYLIVMLAVGLAWFFKGVSSFAQDDFRWGKDMFFVSLRVLLIFSITISIDVFLP